MNHPRTSDRSVSPHSSDARAGPCCQSRASFFARFVDSELILGHRLRRHLSGGDRVLEIGCGGAGRSYREGVDRTILNCGVGIDAFRPALVEWLRRPSKEHARWGSYAQASATSLPFRDESFDVSFAFDVIEHLGRADGHRMIMEMTRVTKRLVLLLTPNGFLPQENDQNPLQRHLSGWNPGDLESLGFRVYGIRGWKPLRRGYSRPSIRPEWIGYAASLLTEPIAALFPERSYQLFAVRFLKHRIPG